MKTSGMNSFPSPVGMMGRPECVLSKDHWSNDWTIAECIAKFDHVPMSFGLLAPSTIVGNIWMNLRLDQQSKLEQEFAYYDLSTGRC